MRSLRGGLIVGTVLNVILDRDGRRTWKAERPCASRRPVLSCGACGPLWSEVDPKTAVRKKRRHQWLGLQPLRWSWFEGALCWVWDGAVFSSSPPFAGRRLEEAGFATSRGFVRVTEPQRCCAVLRTRPRFKCRWTLVPPGCSARFACPATVFVCGAGDGNRTRAFSLGMETMPS